jgi:NADH-quinone oxidoreductase subunit C
MAAELVKILKEGLAEGAIDDASYRGDESVTIDPSAWLAAAQILKGEGALDMLADLCAVDYPDRKQRFEVVVHLHSTNTGKRMRMKTRIGGEPPKLASLSGVWRGANWFEREAYDLFGIEFEGHPNLRRILCHEGFSGHALRKDFSKGKRGKIPKPRTLMDEMELGQQRKQSQ